MELNDETLSAYIDGELDDHQRQQVDEALAADPGARLRLARMREADARLRAAFPLDAAAGDDPLAALILGHPAAPAAPAQIRTPARRAWYRRPALLTALAAGFGAIAIGAVLLLGGGIDPGRRADAALSAALDQLPSGGERLDGGDRTRLVLSFKADDGRWCRVFEQQVAREQRDGLACHDAEGWRVLPLETGAAGETGLKPAGANAAIDTLMDRLGNAPVAEPADEQRLIAHGWTEPAH